MFLTIDDYTSKIRNTPLQQMIDSNPDVLAELENDAQIMIETDLRSKYDVVNIFNKTGADRHRDIVRCMIDIVLYWVSMRLAPKLAQETRVELYKNAVKWLEKVASGDKSPDLPILNPEKNMPSGFRLTSKQEPQDYTF